MNSQILIPEIVEGLRALNREDPAIFGKVTTRFQQACRDMVKQLQTAVEEKDYDALAMTAHSLKGSSGSLGSRIVSDLCSRMQGEAKVGNWDAVEAVMEDLPTELEKFYRALDHEIM